MTNQKTNQLNLELLQRVPKDELTLLAEAYLYYVAKYKYLRYIILAIVVVIAGYNFFIAGKRFTIDELNTIQGVMVGIMGIAVIALLILAVVLFKTLRQLKKELTAVATKHHVDPKSFRKEFHSFVKSTLGGPGLR